MAVAKEYTINDPEDLLQCPYESAHMIRAKRMQYHLMKCRKVGGAPTPDTLIMFQHVPVNPSTHLCFSTCLTTPPPLHPPCLWNKYREYKD